jgi:hypothetical protein
MNRKPFDIAPIESWIESLEPPAVLARIQQIGHQIEQLTEERHRWEAALDFKKKWDESHLDRDQGSKAKRSGQAVPQAHLPLDGGPPIQGKTDGALRVLGSDPNREWNAFEIGEELVRRGLMEDNEGEYASLASTLSRLYSEGKIHRPYRGHYRLSPPDGEAQK